MQETFIKTAKEQAIETKNLSFNYKGIPIIKGLDLKVERGSIYGFLGPNGAGKTTTIRLLLGLLSPKEGKISLLGSSLNINRGTILKKVGALIETPSLYDHLSGYDNLCVVGKYRNVGNNQIQEVLNLVKLYDSREKLVSQYSLGMKQRLGLAMALLDKPDVLILDEPVNGLDPMGIVETRQLLFELNEKYGTTIFLSSHLLTEIEKLVTHVGIINEGRLIFQGPIAELDKFSKNAAVVKIGTTDHIRAQKILQDSFGLSKVSEGSLIFPFKNLEQVNQITIKLVAAGLPVYHIEVQQDSLEKTFIKLTQKANELI
ncbi:ABC-2 type transport system ATP-binding protein [Mucilaginibacter gracilis]|uniref:ABC-2 type transport system ATP-binding protein n=1 Tax=Mucilaginibacter gracilis TaxID=423350 RepID=A0A495IVB7_9SPHI|nr:ATP-binding cassette domain-containing protein [Mucilaginibacter gracilis]RKR80522.1 ABC-2 type transport system ATP-binding protein [Mucilaginibacter gracilis]